MNGSFEDPASVEAFSITPAQNVPGWDTTASDQRIEIWQDGYLGVPAIDGEQFAELNANVPSELFQAQPTTPGALVAYRVFHRGREGVDTMEVRIGPPDGPPGFVRSVQTGKNAWVQVAGTYLVPPGQTSTRFGFAAIDTATGNLSIGNFLDGVEFSSSTCALTVTKALRPRDDRGRFNLLVDGVVRARRVGHGGTTGALPIPAGTRAHQREGRSRHPPVRLPHIDRLRARRRHGGARRAQSLAGARVRAKRPRPLPGHERAQGPSGTSRPAHPAAAASSGPGAARPGAPVPPAVPVPPQQQAEISLRKTASARSVESGQPVRYRVAVRSRGPVTATDLLVCDRLPEGLMFMRAPSCPVSARPPVLAGASAGEREAAHLRADRAGRSPSRPSS